MAILYNWGPKNSVFQCLSYTLPPQPPAGSFPSHVDSSNYHTQSSVHLGWSRDWLHPSGTMAASYQPLSQLPHRAKAPSTDNLPLHYFPGHLMKSTTADSYRNVENGSMLSKIKPQALNNVRKLNTSIQLENFALLAIINTSLPGRKRPR